MRQKEKPKPAWRIFLSHAAADREYARKLSHALLFQWPDVRIFTTDMLSAGEEWQSKLRRELVQCDIFMVVLTPNSVDSNWVLQELGGAWALGKPIVPVVTQPEVFSRIPLALDREPFLEVEDLDKPAMLNRVLERYLEVAVS
jgi:nucleoside 2-deoxyribosyltransferase